MKYIRLVSVRAVVCLTAFHLFEQATTTATLGGTVLDKTQAVIPGAVIRIANKETGLTRSATSNNEGLYIFNLLPAGHYEIRVSVKRFATAVFENVELTVGQITAIDDTMSPSSQAETITV